MMANNFRLSRVNVRRRLKPRPRRPKKIGNTQRNLHIIMQHNERPRGEDFMTGKSRSLFRVFTVRQSFDDQTAATEDLRASAISRQFSLKLARQLAHSIAQAKQDGFASFVHLAARVIERVHRDVRENEEIALEPCAREYVLKELAKIFEVLGRVREYQKLRQRELAFA